MGCILSSSEKAEDSSSDEVYVYVPGFRTPKYVDLKGALQGSISTDLASRLHLLRSQVLIASSHHHTPASKSRRKKPLQGGPINLGKALENYLPVLLGFVNGGEKLLSSEIVFEWTNVEDEKKETALGSVHYELLSVLHLLGVLTLYEANICLTPRAPQEGFSPKVTEESKRNAIETLLKAASYFECAIRVVLPNMPEDIKAKLPADLSESLLRAMEHQALGQGVEVQLGFAVDDMKASLAVKRRLCCEHAKVWEEANEKIGHVPLADGWREKHQLFMKWKLLEAKAGAYCFHGLILDEGYEANSHAQALVCLNAAQNFLKESQKTRTDFGNSELLTKLPPVWGHMRYLLDKVPREATSKARVFRENYRNEKLPRALPKLPDFPLALIAEPYHLPAVDPAWEKEPGFKGVPSNAPDVPSFLARRDFVLKTKSDLKRARPLSPPLLVTPDMVLAR